MIINSVGGQGLFVRGGGLIHESIQHISAVGLYLRNRGDQRSS